MSILLPITKQALDAFGIAHNELPCDPNLADTAAYCEHYGFSLSQSANAIIVASRTDPVQYSCCIVLATTKLDVNKAVCLEMGVKKASFASGDQTIALTGMQIGGVTPFGIPEDIPIYVDSAVMQQKEILMGGGNRSSKVTLNPQELMKMPQVKVVERLAKPKEV